jgi:hypothetical protein
MARLKHGGENVGLREYLIEYADDVLMPVMGAVCEVFADSVAQLKAGGEYTFHRYELPDDHPARREGELHDYVTLGTDDVLRSAD